eukprot:1885789-Rhodomonas_salina.1
MRYLSECERDQLSFLVPHAASVSTGQRVGQYWTSPSKRVGRYRAARRSYRAERRSVPGSAKVSTSSAYARTRQRVGARSKCVGDNVGDNVGDRVGCYPPQGMWCRSRFNVISSRLVVP